MDFSERGVSADFRLENSATIQTAKIVVITTTLFQICPDFRLRGSESH